MDTIYKIGAIILRDKKILVGKKGNKFIIPGGRIEVGENHVDCLRRELREELEVDLISQEFFGTFEDDAALDPGKKIKMEVYMVDISGELKASSEIEELRFIDSKNDSNIKLGSIIEKFVIPDLMNKGMIN